MVGVQFPVEASLVNSMWDKPAYGYDVRKDLEEAMKILHKHVVDRPTMLLVGKKTWGVMKLNEWMASQGYHAPWRKLPDYRKQLGKIRVERHYTFCPRWFWRLLNDLAKVETMLYKWWWIENHPEYWKKKEEFCK